MFVFFKIDEELMKKLLDLNARFAIGSFGIENNDIIFRHSIMGGDHMDIDEFMENLVIFAQIADDLDDKIISTHGGKTGLTQLQEIVREQQKTNLITW